MTNKGFDPTFPQQHGQQPRQPTGRRQEDVDEVFPRNERRSDLRPEASQPQGPRQSDRAGSGPSESHQGNPASTRASNVRSGRSGSDSGGGKNK